MANFAGAQVEIRKNSPESNFQKKWKLPEMF